MAYLMYHMSLSDIYDPEVFEGMEKQFKIAEGDKITSKHSMGGLFGCYRSNQVSKFGIDFWENNLRNNTGDLRKDDYCSNKYFRHPRHNGVDRSFPSEPHSPP